MPSLTPARRTAAALAALSIISTLAFAAPAVADEPATDPVFVVDETPVDAPVETPVDETVVPEDEAPAEEAPEETPADDDTPAQPLTSRAAPAAPAIAGAPLNQECAPGDIIPVTIDGNADLSYDTRSGGSSSITTSGLALSWHGPDLSQSKVAWYYATNFPLSELGTPTIDYSLTSGASVGQNFSITDNGVWKGNIVSEPGIADYWTSFSIPGMSADPTASYRKAIGTIDDFLAAYYADTINNGVAHDVRVVAIGGSGGSGSEGTGVLHSQSAGCFQLTYGSTPAPTVQECTATTPVAVGASSQLTFDTRTGGSSRVTPAGMAVTWHGPDLSQSKVAWYYATDFPLSELGTPAIDYTSTSGASVGQNFTVYVDGAWKGNIVKEPGIANYWTTFSIPGMSADPTASYRKAIGTIDDFLAAYWADNPSHDVRVKAIGGSGGSGSEGTGVVHSQTAGCLTLTFAATLAGAPTQIAPTNNSTVGSHDFPMTWNDFGAGYTYEIYSTTTDPGTDSVIQSPIGGGLAGLTNPYDIVGVPDATYWWQVRAVDADGNAGAWSSIWKVTVDTVAPTTPTPLTPGGWNMSAGEFTWGASTDTSDVTYEVITGNHPNVDADGRMTSGVQVIGTGISATSLAYAFPTGPVQWQVRAKDAAGNYSAWSAPYGAQIIGVPAIVTPTSGLIITGSSYDVTWTPAYGIGGNQRYDLEITTLVGGVPTATIVSVDGDSTTYTQDFSADDYQGDLSVRVRAVYNIGWVAGDRSSRLGPWSDSISYQRDTVAPGAVTLTAPADHLITSDNAFDLTWSTATDAAKYIFESTKVDPAGATGAFADLTGGGQSIQSTRVFNAGGAPDGTYYWHVAAVDSAGNVGPWAAYRTVTIDTVAPDAATLVAPATASIRTDSAFSFTWTSQESPALYLLEVTTAPALTEDGSFTAVPGGGRFGGTTTSFDATGAPVATYYWHVRVFDAAGNASAWSPTWSVTINAPAVAPVAPAAPNPFVVAAAAVAPIPAPAAAAASTPADGTTDQLPTEAAPTDQLPTEAFHGDTTSGDVLWWPWAVGVAILLLLALLWFLLFRRRAAARP